LRKSRAFEEIYSGEEGLIVARCGIYGLEIMIVIENDVLLFCGKETLVRAWFRRR
jgi:hypothetical protein